MRKKKHSFIFALFTTLYSIWNVIKGVSQEFSIPFPILLAIVLMIYLVWREQD